MIFDGQKNNLDVFVAMIIIIFLIIMGVIFYQNYQLKKELIILSQKLVNISPNPTIVPSIKSESNKELLEKAAKEYMKALIGGNRSVALSYLTSGIKNDVPESWPSNYYGSYRSFEILNEYHSQEEEDQFYNQDKVVFKVKFYRTNDMDGTTASLLFIKENGTWKTLSWYLFP